MQRKWHFSNSEIEADAHVAALLVKIDNETVNFETSEEDAAKAKAFAASFGTNIKIVILIGIGGSSQGVAAIVDALATMQTKKELFILDTVDDSAIEKVLQRIAEITTTIDELVILHISKSGTTLETNENAKALTAAIVASPFGYSTSDIYARTLIISANESPLIEYAQENNIRNVEIPSETVGRMSIFSMAGLIPLCLLDIDIDAFMNGAHSAQSESSVSAILLSAGAWKALWEQGVRVRELVIPNASFIALGKWARQLLAESLGKNNVGFVPDSTLATSDYHSVLQLRLEGPKHTASQFFLSASPNNNVSPSKRLNAAIQKGIFESYEKAGISFETCELATIDAFALGHYMYAAISETIAIAHLFNIDPYTQPAVERYKITAVKDLAAVKPM